MNDEQLKKIVDILIKFDLRTIDEMYKFISENKEFLCFEFNFNDCFYYKFKNCFIINANKINIEKIEEWFNSYSVELTDIDSSIIFIEKNEESFKKYFFLSDEEFLNFMRGLIILKKNRSCINSTIN